MPSEDRGSRAQKPLRGADRPETGTSRPGGGTCAYKECPAFGMWKDRRDMNDIDAWVRALRRGRFDDV